jgi:hypothetical protein
VASSKKAEVLIKRVRESVVKDSEGTTNALRTWLSETERSTK